VLTIALMSAGPAGHDGLAIDVGYFYDLKRRMQTAADAGAVAAAHELKRKTSDSGIIQAVYKDAALNGFDRTRGEVITINRPPTTGSKAGNRDFVEVIITQNAPTYFMRVLGRQTVSVRARATGGLVGSAPACIYVLDPNSSNAFVASGAPTSMPPAGLW